MENLPR